MIPSSSEFDRFGTIQVRGARENNLKNISVDIPRRRFTGVSGSGKSSRVFDTIAAESRRLLNETFSTFVQNFLPRYGQPDVDVLANLSTAIIVDQQRIGGNPRSTLGTSTDIATLLRVLFSRLGKPAVPHALALSFNDPTGMCPECEGLGRGSRIDIDALVDRNKSLEEGPILFPTFNVGGYHLHTLVKSGFFDVEKPLKKYTKEEWDNLLHLNNSKVKVNAQGIKTNSGYEGVIPKFKRLYLSKDAEKLPANLRESFERIVTSGPCAACGGTRLSGVVYTDLQHLDPVAVRCEACEGLCFTDAVLELTLRGKNINEALSLSVVDALSYFTEKPVLATLKALKDVGLGYVALGQRLNTLSGGGRQRLKLAGELETPSQIVVLGWR